VPKKQTMHYKNMILKDLAEALLKNKDFKCDITYMSLNDKINLNPSQVIIVTALLLFLLLLLLGVVEVATIAIFSIWKELETFALLGCYTVWGGS
jgi:hypothetical protein